MALFPHSKLSDEYRDMPSPKNEWPSASTAKRSEGRVRSEKEKKEEEKSRNKERGLTVRERATLHEVGEEAAQEEDALGGLLVEARKVVLENRLARGERLADRGAIPQHAKLQRDIEELGDRLAHHRRLVREEASRDDRVHEDGMLHEQRIDVLAVANLLLKLHPCRVEHSCNNVVVQHSDRVEDLGAQKVALVPGNPVWQLLLMFCNKQTSKQIERERRVDMRFARKKHRGRNAFKATPPSLPFSSPVVEM